MVPDLTTLADQLPAGTLLTDPASMERYSHDEAEWAPYGRPARGRPADRRRAGRAPSVRWCVATACRSCRAAPAPVCPAGRTPIDRLRRRQLRARWTRILRIDPVERFAVVQPGVVNDDLRAACAEHGLWYPPDPASSPWSTIGGNVATNAGGVCCVKYGVTGDYVLGLEVVTGTGELVRLGRRTAKGVAGYDLASLMVGSEGTLGLVTEVTVRLRPARPPEHTVVGFFDSLVAAGEAVAAVARAGVGPVGPRAARPALPRRRSTTGRTSGLEADCRRHPAGPRRRRPAPPATREADSRAGVLRGRRRDLGAPARTTTQEADALFAARRLAYPALERLGPVLTEDVCVPVGRGAGDARPDRGDRRSGTTSSSPTSPTPATATCTR